MPDFGIDKSQKQIQNFINIFFVTVTRLAIITVFFRQIYLYLKIFTQKKN